MKETNHIEIFKNKNIKGKLWNINICAYLLTQITRSDSLLWFQSNDKYKKYFEISAITRIWLENIISAVNISIILC